MRRSFKSSSVEQSAEVYQTSDVFLNKHMSFAGTQMQSSWLAKVDKVGAYQAHERCGGFIRARSS